ncbi:hypothetical protein F52700_5164 [Fusarium sp. NRRL 52700]|nr:hypothetical protein F52700_5164 [Fusarium sp. NRRL 52700]
MSTRRSARIRNIDLGVTPKPAEPAPEPTAPPKRKRKAQVEDDKDEPTTKGKKVPAKKVKATKPADAKAKSKINAAAEIETQQETATVPDDVLSVLPAEILQQILESINDSRSMIKMACTSKRYYALVMAIIHKRISVSTSFWAHIPHVIRRIEPHLSIAQKKQLKREGQYKGQQEKFSTRLDPNAVPACASNVRQMIIGRIDPGKRHKPFLMRYFEEVLKNLHNLEVFDAEDLTESMAESLSKLKKLKSIRLNPHGGTIKSGTMIPLAKLRNLEHICFQDWSYGSITVSDDKVLQSMLLNSLSTLQRLEIYTGKYYSDFLADWEDQLRARDPDALNQEHDFTALKSLTLHGLSFSGLSAGNIMPSIQRAFDFLQLRELKLMSLEEGQLTFFKYLQDLFSKTDKRDIHLRKLYLQMKGPGYRSSYAEAESNPGLSRRLLQSIVKHTDLETLRLHYRHMGSDPWEIPFVSVETVNILVKNLPLLRVFECAPEKDDFGAMGRTLSRAKNLTTLLCINYKGYDGGRDTTHLNNAKVLLDGFLESASSCEKFVWEEHYKLNRITIGWTDFAIGSGLKPKKGFEKPVKVTMGDRAVMVQDLQPKKHGHSSSVYYLADSRWVDQVTRSDRQGPLQLVYDD